MSFLNEERLALYDRLIKEHCLNHNDLLNKVYEIKKFNGRWVCDDPNFFSMSGNKIFIVRFNEEIIIPPNEYGNDKYLNIHNIEDYCDPFGEWSDMDYDHDAQIIYQQTIPMGYSLVLKFEGLTAYRILSHTQEKNTNKLYEPYVLEQGYDIYGNANFIACLDSSLYEKEPEIFVGYASNNLILDSSSGYFGYPDDACSWGITSDNGQRFYLETSDGIIPAGYNIFVKSSQDWPDAAACYTLISSSSEGGGGLPSGSEGQFMVYTNGSWQGKTITVGGSY